MSVKPRTALGRLQRRNHLVHHFAQPGARFGVTTPLWDLVFGTYPAPTRADAGPPKVRELRVGAS